MTSAALIQLLKYVLLLGSVLMVIKLMHTGLYRRYPIFFIFFLFRVPNSIWPFFLKSSSRLYEQFWLVTSLIALVLYILIVLELYRLVLENYKGLYSAGRWAFYISLAFSITLSAISLLPTIKPGMPGHSKVLFYEFATERGVDTSLAIFIILMLCFLSLFPIKLSRNVRVLALGYSIFFLSNTFVVLMWTLFGLRMADVINTTLLGVTAASVLAWLILFSPAGETTEPTRIPLEKGYEQRLLTHLDAVNSALLYSVANKH